MAEMKSCKETNCPKSGDAVYLLFKCVKVVHNTIMPKSQVSDKDAKITSI